MPVLESGDDPLIGGQAVIEGVMMRSPNHYCVAVRRPGGGIVTQEGAARRLSEDSRFWKLPVLRGVATLGQAMTLGVKALQFSAKNAIEEKGEDGKPRAAEIPGWMLALNVAFSLVFFIFLYKFVPLVAASWLQDWTGYFQTEFSFSLVDGIIRLGIFLAFLGLISRMNDIRRVFQYHGAEHKVVFNYESGKPVDIPTAQSFSTFHPRCGTSFLMVVMLVSIGIYALIPFEGFLEKFASRVVLLPVIAGVSYEVIRFAARRQSGLFGRIVAPGLWLQRVTTQPPSDDQLEISIRALDGAMQREAAQKGQLVVA